jgi:hypothetical protein
LGNPATGFSLSGGGVVAPPPYRITIVLLDRELERPELTVTIYPVNFNAPIGMKVSQVGRYFLSTIQPKIIFDINEGVQYLTRTYANYRYKNVVIPQALVTYEEIIKREIGNSNLPPHLQEALKNSVRAKFNEWMRLVMAELGWTGGGSGGSGVTFEGGVLGGGFQPSGGYGSGLAGGSYGGGGGAGSPSCPACNNGNDGGTSGGTLHVNP